MDILVLPEGFEWCRRRKHNVQVELGCYPITNANSLVEGFKEKIFDVNRTAVTFAVKSGFNILERNNWTSSPDRPFILTGTVKERWPVKLSDMKSYVVDPSNIGINSITISTKEPSEQEFLVAFHVPNDVVVKVIPSWAFSSDGKIDASQIMISNSELSLVSHDDGDYIVAKHIPGHLEYMQLPEEKRNTFEIAKLYNPRIVNGSVMKATYDCAKTQTEIVMKYQHN